LILENAIVGVVRNVGMEFPLDAA